MWRVSNRHIIIFLVIGYICLAAFILLGSSGSECPTSECPSCPATLPREQGCGIGPSNPAREEKKSVSEGSGGEERKSVSEGSGGEEKSVNSGEEKSVSGGEERVPDGGNEVADDDMAKEMEEKGYTNCADVRTRRDCTSEEVLLERKQSDLGSGTLGRNPDYKKLKKYVNETLGPCFVNVIAELLFSVEDVLVEHNVPHFWSFGTMLGAIRNQSIIPWTSDVDVSIEKAYLDTNKLNRLLLPIDIAFWLDKHRSFGRMCFKRNHPVIRLWAEPADWSSNEMRPFVDKQPYGDVYAIGYSEDGCRASMLRGPGGCSFPKSAFFPNRNLTINGRNVTGPHDPLEIVYDYYGPNFMAPPAHGKHIHGTAYCFRATVLRNYLGLDKKK